MSRLRELARREERASPAVEERCDLCGAPLDSEHRHLIDVSTREISCACRPCSLLFDRRGAGGGHYRLIGDRRGKLVDFEITDAAWDELRIPVEMAFFFRDSVAERIRAYYPSPMGPTESLLALDTWQDLELEPDVEALLVDRSRGCWLVPIDDCYRLVGLIRTHWRGFTGGREVWDEIDRFFADLDRRGKEMRWGRSSSASVT
jgi:Family of unknown function (DUF5947)